MHQRLPYTLVVLVMAFVSSACTIKQAQIATQANLTSTAEGVQASADILARSVPEAVPGEGIEVYRERAASYYSAATAYDVAADALLALQRGGQDIWVATGDLPAQWTAMCAAAGDAIGHLLQAFTDGGLDVPALLEAAPGAVEMACNAAAAFIPDEEPAEGDAQ